MYHFFEDTRREARKAFLAFSSENEGLKLAGQVDEDDSGSAPDMPVVKDDQFSSTPVSLSPLFLKKINQIEFMFYTIKKSLISFFFFLRTLFF